MVPPQLDNGGDDGMTPTYERTGGGSRRSSTKGGDMHSGTVYITPVRPNPGEATCPSPTTPARKMRSNRCPEIPRWTGSLGWYGPGGNESTPCDIFLLGAPAETTGEE